MDVAEAIKKRRCIREYSEKCVSWDDLSEILHAGVRAPSAGNLQNWRFIVIDQDEIKEELAKASLNQMWLTQAPYVVLICSDDTELKRYYPKKGEILYPIQNCACAAENMLLMATEKGIDSGWVGAFDDSAIKRIIKLPDNVHPQAILTFGYRKFDLKEPTKRFSVDKITYFNEWGGANKEISKGVFPLVKQPDKIKKEGRSLFAKFKGMFNKKEKEEKKMEEEFKKYKSFKEDQKTF